MRVHHAAPVHTPKTQSHGSFNARDAAKAFDKKFLDKDTGYDFSSAPSAGKLPSGSDAAAAAKVFAKWADGSETHKFRLPDGKAGYSVSWNADETGGVELFDSKGKRFASQGWGDDSTGGSWEFGAKSRFFDDAKQGISDN
jgi:hypothetical protein